MRAAIFICLAIAISGLSVESVAADDNAPRSVESYSVSPVLNASVRMAVLPRYPKRAQNNGLDGEVTIDFTIARHGRARDWSVVASTPEGVFDDEAIDALRYWTFDPARPTNCGTVAQQASQTFVFKHDDPNPVQVLPIVIAGLPTLPREQVKASLDEIRLQEQAQRSQSQAISPRGLVPVKRVEPVYPAGPLERRLEGVVAISFLIEKDGSVAQPKVVDSVRGSLFKSAALRAIRQWRFEPPLQDGLATERTGCHEFLFLADEYKIRHQQKERRKKMNMRTIEPN